MGLMQIKDVPRGTEHIPAPSVASAHQILSPRLSPLSSAPKSKFKMSFTAMDKIETMLNVFLCILSTSIGKQASGSNLDQMFYHNLL